MYFRPSVHSLPCLRGCSYNYGVNGRVGSGDGWSLSNIQHAAAKVLKHSRLKSPSGRLPGLALLATV